MAETALYLALRKISLASRRDDSSDFMVLAIFQSRLRRIESELRMIYCFLDQVETRYSNNQVLVTWIAEAQKLGRLVEETVDVHIHSIFRPFRRLGGRPRFFSAMEGFVKSIEARRRAFTQLMELEEELQHLSETKRLWIQQVPSDSEGAYIVPSTTGMANLSNNQTLLSDFTNEELVGFDAEKTKLTGRLMHTDEAHKVVAVWGPAGSGKTTLVRFVYEQHRNHFDRCAWISMSSCSSAKDILIKMCRELCLEGDTTTTIGDNEIDQDPLQHLIEALRRGGLPENKFLFVFDGLNVIDGISKVCGLIQSRSRIIIITRIEGVATAVDEAPIRLAGLEEPKALELFCRVVFGKGPDISVELVSENKNAKDIFDRCKCLPQLIIPLGTLIASNGSTQLAFEKVQKQLEWVSKNNSILDDINKCLYVAYINLPKHLKICLLYCGIFPLGHLLLRENLVRLLVAEGFIDKRRPSEVDEEVAEEYLKVLTYLGFLQVVDIDEFGQVVSLRLSTVVHELVQSICRKEGFGVASDDFDLQQTDTNSRCLFTSIYPQDIRWLMHVRTLIVSDSAAADSIFENTKHVASNLVYAVGRTMILVLASFLSPVTGTVVTEAMEVFDGVQGQNTFAYITVLEFHGYPLEHVPYYIRELFNLRYLGLRKTKVRSLPKAVSRLYNMQILDLESSNITELPDWIGKLVRLTNLLAGERKVLKGVGAAKSMRKLKDLHTLQTVEASPTFVKQVDKLTQLRSLSVSSVDRKSWRTLLAKMPKLCSLTSFVVSAKDQNEVLDLDGHGLRFKQLKSLELRSCKLGEDPIKPLSNVFPNLVFLSLCSVIGIKKLEFKANEFTKLRTLNLQEMSDVEELLIPVGARASLEVLRVEEVFLNSSERFVVETTDVPESSTRAAQP